MAPSGVYKNPRLMHVCTTSIGYTVQLQHKDGSVWEGIFSTFSESFTVCLDLAVPINPKLNTKDCLFQALKNGSQVKEQAFFDLEDIVRITVVDVDMTYATKEADRIATDSDISGFNPNKLGEHRQLETWIADDEGDNANADSLLSLDEVGAVNKSGSQNSRGWDAQDMFRYNERVHKVNSTYDEELQDYTIALPRHSKNDRDWRKKQERAAAIAREIESNPQSLGRLAKEDASDNEEEKYSAVIRPTTNQPQPQQPPAQAHPRIINQVDDSSRPPQQQSMQMQQQLPQPQHQHSPQQQSAQQQSHPHHQQPQHQQTQHQQHQQPQHQQPQHQHQQHQRPLPNRINNGTHKNFRAARYDRRLDSLKNFGKQLNLAPSPRQPQGQPIQMQSPATISQNQPSPPQQSHQKPTNKPLQQASQHQPPQSQSHTQSQPHVQPPTHPQQQPHSQSQPAQQQPHHHLQPQQQTTPQQQTQQQSRANTTPTTATTTSTPAIDTSVTSERSETGSSVSSTQTKDQSEIVKNSKLNPNAKEFVYKPRTTTIQSTQTNWANPLSGPSAVEPVNSSPMSHTTHGPYYQQVPIFPHGLTPQQQHHAAQFMPNHAHMHFQSQIHYMPAPMAPAVDPANPSPMSHTTHGQYYQQVPIFPHGLTPQQQHHAAQFMPNHAHMPFQSQIHYMPYGSNRSLFSPRSAHNSY